MGGNRTGGQRKRDAERRPHRASVRMNDDEFEAIAAKAIAARMTVPSYLVSAGLDLDLDSWRAGTPGDAPCSSRERPELPRAVREALAFEVIGMSRNLRNATANLNQLTRYAHIEHRRPDELPEALAELRAVARRVAEFVDDARVALNLYPWTNRPPSTHDHAALADEWEPLD